MCQIPFTFTHPLGHRLRTARARIPTAAVAGTPAACPTPQPADDTRRWSRRTDNHQVVEADHWGP
jgi:hypothetical protein